jgi:hypothetical protein
MRHALRKDFGTDLPVPKGFRKIDSHVTMYMDVGTTWLA